MFTWGITTLKVVPGTYNPPHCENGLTEINILPDASGNLASVMQQAGRGRYRASFDGFTSSYAAYKALLNDSIAQTERVFVDGNETLTMTIESLSPATMVIDGKWEYSITLMEV